MVMRAESLDRALPAIAGFIADRTGIPIIRSGRAETDNETIYLPRRHSEFDLTQRDLVESVAYLYHEAGHMLHSNFTLGTSNPLKKAIANVLEDVRIEGMVMAKFPAARRYLSRLTGYMVEDAAAGKSGFPELKGSESEAVVLQRYMLYRLRSEVLRQTLLDELAASAYEVAQKRFPATMLTRLDALMFEVNNCVSEDDVFDLADAIIQMIEEEKEREHERQQQQQQDDHGEDDSQGQPQSGSDDDQGEDDSQGQPQSGSDDGQGGQNMAQALDQLLNMSEQDIEEDLGEQLKTRINASAQAEAHVDSGCHVPFPNVYKSNLMERQVDMAEIRASINAIRTKTLHWMGAVAESEVMHARSGMQIDSSRLWQRRFGSPIFVQEDEGIDINAAVSIVIDRSGSMTSQIRQAAQAAVATMLAFEVPGLKTQVSVFPWYHNGDEGVSVVKRWDEKPRNLAGRITNLTCEGGTPMAEAIAFAATDVIRREESLKIVLVVTDGEPNDVCATKHIIDRARKSGVAVLAQGIGIDPSLVFGSRYASSIADIGQLSGCMVRLIKAAYEDYRQQQ